VIFQGGQKHSYFVSGVPQTDKLTDVNVEKSTKYLEEIINKINNIVLKVGVIKETLF
jgi:hypothetical protein